MSLTDPSLLGEGEVRARAAAIAALHLSSRYRSTHRRVSVSYAACRFVCLAVRSLRLPSLR